MPARRRRPNDDSATRTAFLDAAEAVMLEEGYAAVSSRRIASRAGLPNAIHYYFETMDDLFVELFRRGAARSLERQEEVLASAQPLWAFWDLLLDRSNGDLNTEFIALANHRKAIRSEIAESSRTFRRGQLDALGGRDRGVQISTWFPVSGGDRSPPQRRFSLSHHREGLRPGYRPRGGHRVRGTLHWRNRGRAARPGRALSAPPPPCQRRWN